MAVARSTNSAAVAKHKEDKRNFSAGSFSALAGEISFYRFSDKKDLNWKEVIKVVALDEIKGILNTYEVPLKELRDSL